jgi:hypothetical protein
MSERNAFDQAYYDSGYALTPREEHIATCFFTAGVQSRGCAVSPERARDILNSWRPDAPVGLQDVTWVFTHSESEPLRYDEKLVMSLVKVHYDEYDDWDKLTDRVCSILAALQGSAFDFG